MVAAGKNRISTKKAILMYIVVSLFLFFEMAVQVSPSVISSQLMHSLSIGALGLGIMSGFYFYSYAAMQIPSGILFDTYNPRRIIAISILICSLGTLLFSFSGGMLTACLARLLMGAGSAFAFVSVLVVTSDLFPKKYFATMTGITQMLAAFGAMSGQLPISLAVSYFGWRHTLLNLALVGLVLSLAVFLLIRYRRPYKAMNREQRIRLVNSLRIISKNKQTWFIGLYALLLWAPMSGFTSLWGVPFLMHVDGLDSHTAAFLCSLMWLGLAIASPLLGLFATLINNRIIPLILSALIGMIAFALILFFRLDYFVLAVLLFLAGAACSGQALSFTVVKNNNEESHKATAIAFNNMAVVFSGALFQPIIGAMLHQSGDYQFSLLIVLGAYVFSFLLAVFLIRESGAS